MTQAFRLGPPDDLVWPRASSMTSRALVSFAQRSLFEARGELLRPELAGSPEGDAIALWLEIVAGMLPGNPHAVARSLRDPAVAIPARMLLRGEARPEAARAFAGSALLWLALEGVLDRRITLPFATRAFALGHAAWTEADTLATEVTYARIPPIEGRLLALDAGPWSSLGLARVDGEHEEASTRALRDALALLTRYDRTERDELDRIAAGFVRGARLRNDVPLGLVFVPTVATPAKLVEHIREELVTEKLALLRLGDPVAEPFEPFRALCAGATRVRPGDVPGAEEVRALAERVARVLGAVMPTPVGEGVALELCARVGLAPKRRTPP